MQQLAPIPEMVSISPLGISIYNDYSYLDKRESQKNCLKNLENNNHKGLLSPSARKNLKNAIGYLILKTQLKYRKGKKLPNVNNKITFITLTLPSKQKHSDQEIKDHLLHQLIIEIRSKYKMNEYVWRAERQKNGNLHIHLLTNTFIPHDDLRNRWNRILNKLNYVDDYTKKHKNLTFREYIQLYPTTNKKGHSIQDRIRQYEHGKQTNWMNPNSTDIAALKKVKNAGAYISKYCSKSIEDDFEIKKIKGKIKELNRDDIEIYMFSDEIKKRKEEILDQHKIDGRIWFASETLTNIKNFTTELTSEIKADLQELIKKTKAKEIETDFCYWINRGFGNIIETSTGILNQLCNQYLLFNFEPDHPK